MKFGDDHQEIKSWIENDNHAYRLGDVVLHSGKYFEDLKSCTLSLHNETLAAKYLQRSEYKENPMISKNRIRNMEVFNEVLIQNCPKLQLQNTTKTHVMIHLRLGDGVYGDQRVAVLRTPYPLRCYKEYLQNYNISTYVIGLIHNNTAASIFAVSPASHSMTNNHENNNHNDKEDERRSGESSYIRSSSNRKSKSSGSRVAQYLQKLKIMFPNSYDFEPQATPDDHFCAMVNAPVLVTGKGTIPPLFFFSYFILIITIVTTTIMCLFFYYY